jgi:hypothetical protein
VIAGAIRAIAPAFRALWPDAQGQDDHGRGEGGGGDASTAGGGASPRPIAATVKDEWPAGLTKISGAKGSNPGGLMRDAQGRRWYVKEYADPGQAAAEHVSNQVYRALGLGAPESVLGEGGQYASAWREGGRTLADAGLTKGNADAVLDGFAADVLTMNWDAVGTGHDNVLVEPKGVPRVTRVDQGGTLTYRAQGGPKPEAALDKIGEWDSLHSQNDYYRQVFKAAGVKGPDDPRFRARAIAQITRIEGARPSGGWRTLVDRAAPRAPAKLRERWGRMLDARSAALSAKRAELEQRHAAFRAAWPASDGSDDHGRGDAAAEGRLRDLWAEHGDIVPVEAVFGRGLDPNYAEALAIYAEADTSREGEVRPVDLGTIRLVQEDVGWDGVREALRGRSKSEGAPIALKLGAKHYLIDGYHRASAAVLRGEKAMPMEVYDGDAIVARGLAEFDEAKHPRDQQGKFSSGEGEQGEMQATKVKAPKATKEQIAKVVELKKAGHAYAHIHAQTGINPKQAATIVHKYNKASDEAKAAIAAAAKPAADPLATGPAQATQADVAKADAAAAANPAPAAKPEPKPFADEGNKWAKDGSKHVVKDGQGNVVKAFSTTAKGKAEAVALAASLNKAAKVENNTHTQAYNPSTGKYEVTDPHGALVGAYTDHKDAYAATKALNHEHTVEYDPQATGGTGQGGGGYSVKNAAGEIVSTGHDYKGALDKAKQLKQEAKAGDPAKPLAPKPPPAAKAPEPAAPAAAPAKPAAVKEGQAAAAEPIAGLKPGGVAQVEGHQVALSKDGHLKVYDQSGAQKASYEWKEKATGPNKGQYAYYKDGAQVSSFAPKADFEKAIGTIAQGKGPVPKAAKPGDAGYVAPQKLGDVEKGAATPGGWPIADDVVRTRGENYHKQVSEAGNKWTAKLTAGERSALTAYTGSSYGSVNSSLRSGGDGGQTGARIAAALAKADPPPPPDLVWRGVSGSGAKAFAGSLEAGDVITMKGFQSTSINPGFAAGWGSGQVLFEIKPSRGGFVKGISSHKNEDEYLLPHAAKYTVVGTKTIKMSGGKGHAAVEKTVIQLEMHK